MKYFLLQLVFLFAVGIIFPAKVFAFCPYECDCRDEPSQCPAGVSLVTDGCNCCKVCAKQRGEQCNGFTDVCDPHRNLFCDFAQSRSGDWGVCSVQNGRFCVSGEMLIPSGSMFELNCKTRCWCMDGAIGCVPLCPHETQIPRQDLCPNARLQTVAGQCCEQWVCDTSAGTVPLPIEEFWEEYVREEDLISNSTGQEEPDERPLDDAVVLVTNNVMSGPSYEEDGGSDGDELDYQMGYVDSASNGRYGAYGSNLARNNFIPGEDPGESSIASRGWRTECAAQASAWSPCSKTCGLGISTRVTNMNRDCSLKREVRLCIIRPCSMEEPSVKHGKRCVKQKRASTRSQLSYAGCLSIRSFKLRFCGKCSESSRCCTPRVTRTTKIRFRCPDGHFFYKNLMTIRSCRCHRHCSDVTANHYPGTF